MIIIAPGRQERLPQALGGLEEERTYLLELTRALLEKLEERYLGGRVLRLTWSTHPQKYHVEEEQV